MAKKTKQPDPIEAEEYDWRGEPHWRCPVCGRDAENKSVIDEHIAAAHTAKPHPLAPAVANTEENAHGTANADQDDDSGAEPDGGRGGDDDGGKHDGSQPVRRKRE